jgi:putative hydroxymethylpyrimidine transport system permease protein
MTSIYRSLFMFAVFILVWQLIIVMTQLPMFILPTPKAVALTLWNQANLLAKNAGLTVLETILGLGLGVLAGVFIALMMASLNTVRVWLLPIIVVSQAIPTFAVAPLLVIWLGYGIASKVFVVALMLFFPVASAFFDGLRRTRDDWLELAEVMNAKPWRILWQVRVPAALPSLATGLRLATAMAPLGAVVGEWVGASRGLGFLMLSANARLDISLVFAALFVLIVFSLLLYSAVDRLLRRLVTW